MKPVLVAVAVVGLAAVAVPVVLGTRLFEPKVTPDPYRAGLEWDRAQQEAARPDCAISAGPCTANGLTLELTPRPVRAMADVVFTVAGPFPEGATGTIALGMPGMYMGENRVRLARLPDGRLQGHGVFVRCPSGGHTWSAAVAVAGVGAPRHATFTFDLE